MRTIRPDRAGRWTQADEPSHRAKHSPHERSRMTSDRWEHIFTLFDAALARPEAERAGFLTDQCGEDAHLRQEVESLLAAHGDAEGFLSGRQARSAAADVDESGPVPPSLTRGMRLGVFDVESFIGAGGMGEVYRARDTRLDRHVAIKVLSPHAATDPRGRARFAYEARAIARLSHPRICALHEMGHQDGVDFLVMEYLEGETLAARLRKGPMPLTRGSTHGRRDRPGARRCACAGYRSSRPEAEQRHGHRGRREAARLRPCAAPCTHWLRPVAGERCTPQQPDSRRPHRRDAAVHGARTARRQRGGRPSRHLRVWRGPLRDDRGEESIRGDESRQRDLRDPVIRSSSGCRAPTADTTCSRIR